MTTGKRRPEWLTALIVFGIIVGLLILYTAGVLAYQAVTGHFVKSADGLWKAAAWYGRPHWSGCLFYYGEVEPGELTVKLERSGETTPYTIDYGDPLKATARLDWTARLFAGRGVTGWIDLTGFSSEDPGYEAWELTYVDGTGKTKEIRLEFP